ncbi:uncharacterized protein HKW66_Vig0196670 [Vigna angularis]|uniref:Uncharacterized protein n=3 Tax=Phaseolus angularis TaxID=3914 RepID=A0A8T0KML7_PHAAN|nr:uncharacterized protein HKW66_Vig0196670 [Vigna angularis]
MITMMVMVELTKASQSPPSKAGIIDCATKCELECAPLLLPPSNGVAYLVCVFTCRAKCLGSPPSAVDNCIIACGYVDIDVRDLTNNAVDSCAKECLNK